MNGHFRYSLRFIRHCHDIGQAVIKKMGMDLKLQLTQLRLVSELLFFYRGQYQIADSGYHLIELLEDIGELIIRQHLNLGGEVTVFHLPELFRNYFKLEKDIFVV